tara:strand:+ start:5012 stop:5179 length:168 start_codon:yes stop_codon:yes gene_type:complete
MAAYFFEKRGIEVSESIVLVKDEKHYLTSKAIFGILKILRSFSSGFGLQVFTPSL